MKKVIVVLAFVLAAVLALAACGNSTAPAQKDDTPAASAGGTNQIDPVENAKVGISLPPADNVWQAKMLTSVEAAVKNYPDIEWTINVAVDDPDQLNQLTSMKDAGYDLIIALPNDGGLMTNICEQIYDAGVYTIILDRDIASGKYTSYVGGDNPGAGRGGAEFIGEFLGGEGKIATLRCYAGSPSDLDINNNFMEVLGSKYPGIEVVVEGDGEYDSQHGLDAMSNILPAYDHLDAVFAQDDEAALGAMTAIDNANRTDIKLIVGIGGKTEAYEQIKADNTIFKCSMTYLPEMGVDAVIMAVRILSGEEFSVDEIIESVSVTKENVDQFMDKGY